MKGDQMPEKLESVNERIDRFADRLHPIGRFQKDLVNRDVCLIRAFPYFLICCLIIWIASIIYIGDYSLGKMIEILCLVFVACFAALGVPCLLFMDRGVFSVWVLFGMSVVLTGFLWIAGMYQGHLYYAEAIESIFGALGFQLDRIMRFVMGFCGTLSLLFFTSIGVLSIIGAYMSHYMPGVFMSMQKHADSGTRGKAEKFFMVPDIIDVREVLLERDTGSHEFNFRVCLSVSMYLFILGLLVSSYVFINPLLIKLIDWQTMLAITFMLSMFTPALILPWQIVRGVGAKVRSDAPRDYYLWTGAKKRLFSSFMALGAFMMMFIISVYLGNSVWAIVSTYISFLVPLFVTSVIYGALYVNNFNRGVCKSICDGFEQDKECRENPGRPVDLSDREF